MTLKYETIVNGPFQENCYLVWDDEDKTGIFIDPGDEASRLVRTAEFLGIRITFIFNTHGHIDHAGAVQAVKQKTQAPFAMHPADRFLLDSMPTQAKMFGLPPMDVPSVDKELAHGDTHSVGSHEFRVIHTPGHTPGGVSFRFADFVVVGDTLFAGSIGRSDLPGGDGRQLIESIKTNLLTLPEDLRVLSGHGPSTTIGLEKRSNPFLNGSPW